MSSPDIPIRRRRRAEFERTREDQNSGLDEPSALSDSGSSKRTKTRESSISSTFENYGRDMLPRQRARSSMTLQDADGDMNYSVSDKRAANDQYQPGAILRVKVINFVTYEEAEFHPGPNLNMVIGPNGTGKSSLVCAICLGLGYSPVHLGRAQKVGEFVKHGKDDAAIEIELQKRPTDAHNHIIRVRITRDGDKRKWWINNRETSLKAVQTLTRGLGIQVDNLCQFLPQDRVAEFAGLNPVELLHHTQRAAAPEEMLTWHEQLKNLRKEEKALQEQHEMDQEALRNQVSRQENLRADVERLKERQQIQERISLLEKTVPFLEYAEARQQHYDHKELKQEAQRRLKGLERRVEPTMRAVNAKQQYQSQIEEVVTERKRDMEAAERGADIALKKVDDVDADITQIVQMRKAEIEDNKARKQDLDRTRLKIKDMEARLQNSPPEFDPESWNSRIRAEEHQVRQIDAEIRNVGQDMSALTQQGSLKRREIDECERELEDLNSQAGQQVTKLKLHSADTAQAWNWIQKHMDQFEKQVYGPPIVECSVKDARYIDAMESIFQKSDLLSITAQTRADFKKLSDLLYRNMKLADINIKCQTTNLAQEMQRRPNISSQYMKQCGLDGWASEFIEGPDPVLAMLCSSANLQAVGIALQDVTNAQYDMILESRIGSWASGKHVYKTTRRAEYGAAAVSTTSRTIRKAQVWTDQPADAGARRDIEEKNAALRSEFEDMKVRVGALRARVQELKTEKENLNGTLVELKKEKSALQTAAGVHAALPAKIEREKESLNKREQQGFEIRQRVNQLSVEEDDLVLKKTDLALEHKAHVEALRSCHELYLEAAIRLAEAKSDVSSLTNRNKDIAQRLEDERRLVAQVEREAKLAKDAASKALEVCKAIMAEEEDGPNKEHFNNIDTKRSLIDLQHEIEAERSKLEFIHDGNQGALKEFESRQVTISKLHNKIEDIGRRLEKMNQKVSEIRQLWEPQLDKLVQEISNAFAYNFEQIGCAGEVGVHKDEDFDLWAIEIKVKFRENETLQLLDQHRQSGGERSVSTIFYLMSLQSLARAPFRVVDEINQGMDPRNERMVHERMVEIACKEHTSQYFLITPKLLRGLKYDPRMKVLCIASGEYMPEDHSLLDVRRAIQIKARAVAAAG